MPERPRPVLLRPDGALQGVDPLSGSVHLGQTAEEILESLVHFCRRISGRRDTS